MWANIGGAPVALDTTGLNSYATANGLPSAAFANAAFASHPNVAAAFGAAGATALGALTLPQGQALPYWHGAPGTSHR